MTNEEMQEKVEFILEQQARFAVKVDTLADIHANSETRLARLEESFALLVQMAKLTDERQDAADRQITRLAEKVNTLVEKMEELAETQKNSDERLNTLIGIFERYISEGRDGGSQ